MADIIVGKGTQVQVVINMTPITGEEGNEYSLGNLTWHVVFTGNTGSVTIQKADAKIIDNDNYEVLVNTELTGVSEDLTWRLYVDDIPTATSPTGARKEVTPEQFSNIEVV